MRKKCGGLRFVALSIIAGAMLMSASSPGESATLRINMKDGTAVEVPYYWEENGELKFEIAGGVAGVPKSQVESVHEILSAKEFDPEVILDPPSQGSSRQEETLRKILETEAPDRSNTQKLSHEESMRLLEMATSAAGASPKGRENLQSPGIKMEGDFADLVRLNGNEVMLLLKNVASTRSSIKDYTISLSLFDGDGKLIQQKPCELYELSVDKETKHALGTTGQLFSIKASIKPDPSIKRYEIVATKR